MKKGTVNILIVVFIILVFITSKFYSQEIDIKDGVKYIKNKAYRWKNEKKVNIEFLREIGRLDVENEDYIMAGTIDLCKDILGNIYILDLGHNRIKKFDKYGKFIKNIGRKGKGPGEFNSPNSIDSGCAADD